MPHLPQRTSSNESLHRECGVLQEQLTRLVEEHTARLHIEGPRLEARWLVAVGGLQLQVLEAECAVRRLRRKIELLRAALYREEAPDLTAVESRLDAEMARWQASVQEEAHRLRIAQAWIAAPLLSPAEVRESQRLFRRLARRCHPDANPSGGAAAEALWLRASAAYADGALDELRALALLADDLPVDAADVNLACERRDALKAAVIHLIDELAALDAQYPFTLRARLADDEELARERDALQQKLALFADERLLLEAAVAQMVGEVEDV